MDLPGLDAISLDPRDAEKEVVAKSLLTLAVSLTDQNLNGAASEIRTPDPIITIICSCPTGNDRKSADPTKV